MKTIGVLTSGGDAPGMNAAVRAVVRTCCANNIKVFAIKRGYAGLISGQLEQADVNSVSDILYKGGTALGSARCKEFQSEDGMQKAIETCRKNGIEGLVVIGGDGSFRGASALSERGLPCVGVPATIDNDIACSDYTIGYDTCLNTVMDMVDKISDTAKSHDRCTVVEVMGRDAGFLTLNAGIAVGATAIVVPEIKVHVKEHIISHIENSREKGKKHFIIMIAEGVGGVEALAEYIEEKTGIESRASILGHVQRGGSPTVRDRVLASEMGYSAVKLLMQGMGNRVVAIKKDEIVNYDIYEALNMKKTIDQAFYNMAHEISI